MELNLQEINGMGDWERFGVNLWSLLLSDQILIFPSPPIPVISRGFSSSTTYSTGSDLSNSELRSNCLLSHKVVGSLCSAFLSVDQ